MVVGENSGGSWGSDVVLLVEATANLFPFVESIKTNYIVPTLELFNGAPADDRDYGYDSIINCSYTLLTFTAADSAPDPACITVTPPTSSIGKILTAFDKLLFAGGAAEQCSHITEGIATALQVFEDLAQFKNGSKDGSKHCILICNSPPYQLPVLETSNFQGKTLDQLAMMLQEKSISLTVICPRKIPQLCKLFEKAGGDLIGTLGKNYAKDKRHLILPNGFALAERSVTPPPEAKQPPASPRSPIAAQKRNAPPGSSPPREAKIFKQPGSVPSPQQVPVGPPVGPPAVVQRGQAPTPPQMGGMNQPNPPNVNIRQFNAEVRSPSGGRGHGGHWNNPSPPVSTPSPTNMSLLQSQLSTAPMQAQNPGQFPQNQMYRQRMVGPNQMAVAPNQNQGSPGMPYGNQQQMMSGMSPMNNQGPPQPMNQNPMMYQGPMNQSMPPNQNNPAGPGNQHMMGVNQGGMPIGPAGQHMGPGQQIQQRKVIWQGDIEYHDRSNQPQRNAFKLHCVISSNQVSQGTETEVSGTTWPEKMVLQLLPRNLIMSVMPVVKNAARCVFITFRTPMESQPGLAGNPEGPLANLCRLMSNSYLGFIHLNSPPCDIKVMIVVYMSDKNTFMGLIANDQDSLLNAIKQIFENHKNLQRQQQPQLQLQKNKMVMGQGGVTNQMNLMPQGNLRGQQNVMPGQQGSMAGQQGSMVGPQGSMVGHLGPMGGPQGPMGAQQGGPIGGQQGPMIKVEPTLMGNQPGPMGGHQNSMNNQQGLMSGQQGPMGNQGHGPMGGPQGPIGNQPGPMGPQGPIGNQQGSGMIKVEPTLMGGQQGPMGNHQGPMANQQAQMANQQGPMVNPQGPMGGQQGPMRNQPGPMGGQQNQMGSQQGMMGSQQGPLNSQQGPMGHPQGSMGNQQMPIGSQAGPMGSQQGQMVNQQGPMDSQQGPMSSQQGPIGGMGQQPMMQHGMNQMGMGGPPHGQMNQRMGMPQQQNVGGPGINPGGGGGPMGIGNQGMIPAGRGGGMMQTGGGHVGGGPQGGPGGDYGFAENERKQNLLKIQELQATLEAAQQKEQQYKQQSMPAQGNPVGQMMPQGGQGGHRAMGPGPQMLRATGTQGPQNPQLRHLLQPQVQAQQMRGQMMPGPPGQQQPQQQQQQPQQQMYAQQNTQQQYMQNYNQQF